MKLNIIYLLFCFATVFCDTDIYILTKNEVLEKLQSSKNNLDSKLSGPGFKNESSVPLDNNNNYGDLFHSRRESGDILLIRETLLNELSSSEELYIYWYGKFPARLSHVRVLNFGRERGYTQQISTRNNEGYAETYITIPPYKSVRMFVEIYGFP